MKKSLLAGIVLSVVLLTGISSPAMAAQKVTVTLPTFPVTMNGYEIPSLYNEYPLIVYNNITYFPMTWHYAAFLGLKTLWYDDTLTIEKKEVVPRRNLRWYQKTEANKTKYTASIVSIPVEINGKKIQNDKETYPMLFFRDITYVPLTWRFAVKEFGWEYSFDAKKGLEINSKSLIEIHGKAPCYVIAGDVAVGYPESTMNEEYTFTYKKGTAEEKEFSLESQLRDGDYDFNVQSDKNGYIRFDEQYKASIQGNILIMPCVRTTSGKVENYILEIDFIKGEIIRKTAMELRPLKNGM